MTTEKLYSMFLKSACFKADGTPSWIFKREYGTISIDDAFQLYASEILEDLGYREKIAAFEKFLISINAKSEKSNISESRYYYYNGAKYRFSHHIYPTGSMTNTTMNIVDLAADPQLIINVKY